MKKLYISTLLGIISTITIYVICQNTSSSLSFLDSNAFVTSVVAPENQQAFKAYYQTFCTNLNSKKPEQKAKELQDIRELACKNLEIKHPQWAAALKPYNYFERTEKSINVAQREKARKFLTLYGAHEQFLKEKAQEKASFWYTVKSYTKNVGRQISQWAGSFRRKKVTA